MAAPSIPDWNGEQGEFWVRRQEHQDAVLEPFVEPLLRAAHIGPGDAVLDVGCGCGATTLAAARAASRGHVLGVDISGPMLRRARERADAEGLPGTNFMHADVQTHPLGHGVFDAAISRFGVMFFDDAAAAFANIRGSMRPGARLAFVCWQPAKRNPHISLPVRELVTEFPQALPRDAPQPPFSLAEPDVIRGLLDGAGFADVAVEPIERPLRVGGSVDEVMRHYAEQPLVRGLLAGQDAARVERVRERIRVALEAHRGPDGVSLDSAAWLVTAGVRDRCR